MRYESAVALTEFRHGRVSQIRIYPLMMQMKPGPLFGSPKRAAPADADRILTRLQHSSTQFGTQIRIENHLGVIRVSD
jgi:hypothetical protein